MFTVKRIWPLWFLLSIAVSGHAWSDDVNRDLKTLTQEIELTTEVMANCGDYIETDDVIGCVTRLSEAGNFSATMELAEFYAAPADFGATDRLPNRTKSLEMTLLAIRQGSGQALQFIPPRPYKWEIGMSGVQVQESIGGKPERVIKSGSGIDYKERWIYPNAELVFVRSLAKSKHVVLESIEEIN